jgi:hypothetical protein
MESGVNSSVAQMAQRLMSIEASSEIQLDILLVHVWNHAFEQTVHHFLDANRRVHKGSVVPRMFREVDVYVKIWEVFEIFWKYLQSRRKGCKGGDILLATLCNVNNLPAARHSSPLPEPRGAARSRSRQMSSGRRASKPSLRLPKAARVPCTPGRPARHPTLP